MPPTLLHDFVDVSIENFTSVRYRLPITYSYNEIVKFVNVSADRFSSKNCEIRVKVMIQTLYHYSRKLLLISGVHSDEVRCVLVYACIESEPFDSLRCSIGNG